MNKKQKKQQQQKTWGLTVDAQIPMVLVTDVDQRIQAILDHIVDGVASIGIQLVVVEPSSSEQLEHCREWQEKYPGSITLVSDTDLDAEACDIALMEEVTVDKLKDLRDHHLVPVAEKGVEPFDPIAEKGNGFLFSKGDSWSLFAALVRAAETYRFPHDWKTLLRSQ